MTDFFEQQEWQDALEQGLGCSTTIVANPQQPGQHIVLSVFKRGPFRIAYARFPTGLYPEQQWFLDRLVTSDANPITLQGIDLLRINSREEHVPKDKSTRPDDTSLPDTVIPNLADWDLSQLSSDTRYKIRRSHRDGIRMRTATGADASFLYQCYATTIAKHQGALRYTPAYFQALIQLSEKIPALQAGIAEASGKPCGFIITARDHHRSYYLHGGFLDSFSRYRPGYAAMHWAIESAKADGSQTFEMLPSPAGQSSLVKFKESFLGKTSQRLYWDIPLTWRGRALKALLQLTARRAS